MNKANVFRSRCLRVALIAVILLMPVLNAASAAAYDRLWLWYNDENALQPQIAIDPAGGQHVVFSTLLVNDDGINPVYYGYCPSECTLLSSWSYAILGDLGMFGNPPAIGLTPTGQPRVMWAYYDLVGTSEFYFAECNGSCTNPANWETAFLTDAYTYIDTQSFFAVDPQGVAHFVYDDWYNDPHNGTFYASCASNCTNWASWTEGMIDEYNIGTIDLAFDSAGHPRIAYIPTHLYDYDDTFLYYAECNSSCEDADNWYGVEVAPISGDYRSESAFALEITSGGDPRIAMYVNNELSYAWCNSGCTGAGWNVTGVGYPTGYGEYVDLELDSQDNPHLAYMIFQANEDDGMIYSRCTSGCETMNPVWQHEMVETGDDLDISDPLPTPPGCQANSWMEVGEYASFALDPGDLPHFAYNASNKAVCDGSVNLVIQGVRYADAGTGAPPVDYDTFIFLPTLRK